MQSFSRLLWISAGGAAGTAARYLLSGLVLGALGPGFPYGTLAVNVIGSFLLGAVLHLGLATDWMSPTARLALSTGAMGGFTTYSTFNYETTQYLREGAWLTGGINVVATVVLCLAAGIAGEHGARWLSGG